ncbi:MAG: hypothetical protein HJJLKODD_01756 [Phycisphaerae bacterium]|nr:hypothetical protein [Phycisphaerae bacterium]
MDVHHDRRRLLVYCQIMIVLLGSIALRVWQQPGDLLPTAQAQIPDQGAQLDQLIKATQKNNELLTGIQETLKGTLKVQVSNPSAEGNGKNVPPAPKKPK